jgi:predicted nucleic acid-binding Zn ribbon protein
MGKAEPIGELIQRVLAGVKAEKETVQAQLMRQWPEIVSAATAAHAVPIVLEREVLLVRVDHTGWAHELVMRKAEIITAIGRVIPQARIRNIRCIVGAGTAAGTAPRQKEESAG